MQIGAECKQSLVLEPKDGKRLWLAVASMKTELGGFTVCMQTSDAATNHAPETSAKYHHHSVCSDDEASHVSIGNRASTL